METAGRKTPNTSMTEADWRQAMDDVLGGMTDAEVGRKWGVSNATVASQRHKRGVYRRDRPAAPVAETPSAAVEPPAELDGERAARDDLAPSDWIAGPRESAEGGGPRESAEAPTSVRRGRRRTRPPVEPEGARAWATRGGGLRRAAGGEPAAAPRRPDGQGVEVARLGRSHLLALRARAELLGRPFRGGAEAAAGAGADEALPAPPVLRPAQTPPEGDWRTWLFLGGRGAGKTLAGASWLASQAHGVERLALVGPTLGDVREVMIEGPSGLRGLAAAFGPREGPGDGRPVYEPSRRRLVWPNGARAYVFSAEDPDALRVRAVGSGGGRPPAASEPRHRWTLSMFLLCSRPERGAAWRRRTTGAG